MFKVRFGWFGRVMASCLVAFNLLSGVGFCTHDNCTEMKAIDKIYDFNVVMGDQESIYLVCRNVFTVFNDLPEGENRFVNLLKDIGNSNVRLIKKERKLNNRMYKDITKYPGREKPKYCPLIVTNVWTLKERFYCESKLCKDAIILINNLHRVNPRAFRREINQCRAVFDRNIKKIEAIKNASLVLDPSFFPIVSRRLERLKRHFDRLHTNIIIPTNQTEKLM